MSDWQLAADYRHLQSIFGTLDQVFALEGQKITSDRISELRRVEVDGVGYYVKRYRQRFKERGLLRFRRRALIQCEWENLHRFHDWGLATPDLVGWGLEDSAEEGFRGVLITREVPGTADLASLARDRDVRLQDRDWLDRVSRQLARATRVMHDHHFVHTDLKWRNLLVNAEGELFFIDCPNGGFWWGPLLRQRIIKDLACLDKVAQHALSRTRRLRFYLQYRGQSCLAPRDKRTIRQILRYFEGRE